MNEDDGNAEELRHFNFNSGSNMIDENAWQMEKYSESKILIFRGIITDCSEYLRNAHDWIILRFKNDSNMLEETRI